MPKGRDALTRMILLGTAVEAALAVAALAIGGLMALAATLVGSGIALGAQVAAVAMLRPGIAAAMPQFTQRWALGMAVRFGSFIVVAVVIVAARAVLPPAWVAAGYLSLMLVLLFLETRFLT